MHRSCHSSGPWETANITITGGCYNSSIFHRIAVKCFILHQPDFPRETFLWRCHTMNLSCLQKWVLHICWVQCLWQLVVTLELPVWSWHWVFVSKTFAPATSWYWVLLKTYRPFPKVLSTESCKIFLTSKCGYLLFPNSTHKTKTWFANGWEPTNSKPPRPIIMITYLFGNKEQQSDHIYYTLLWQVLGIICPLPASTHSAKMLGKNYFVELNQYILMFLHSILIICWELQ